MKIFGELHPAKNHTQAKRWLLLNAILLTVVGLLGMSYPVEELSRRIADLNFRLRGTRTTSRDVALVLIDDASLNRYGRWPWKRTMLARVDRKSTRLNSSHLVISYAVFCLKKKNKQRYSHEPATTYYS